MVKTYRIAILIISVICCAFLTGCSGSKVQKVKDIAGDTADYVTEKTSEYKKLKDVNVHTEEEMLEFALSYLEEKYDEKFVIDKSYYKYKHKNGHEDAPMILNARFRPVSDDHLVAAFYVTEPNSIIDNYSMIKHQYDVEDYILPELAERGLDGYITISCPLIKGKVDDDITVEDIIYDEGVDIMFYQPVDPEIPMKDNLPLIRKWMDYLYTCDYEWFFSLTDENNPELLLYQLYKNDHGYTSADDWDDEEILRQAETIYEDSKRRLEKKVVIEDE